MHLRLPSRLQQKPPPGSQVDWSNPLSRGLVECRTFRSPMCEDIANNYKATFDSGYGRITDRGIVTSGNGSSGRSFVTTKTWNPPYATVLCIVTPVGFNTNNVNSYCGFKTVSAYDKVIGCSNTDRLFDFYVYTNTVIHVKSRMPLATGGTTRYVVGGSHGLGKTAIAVNGVSDVYSGAPANLPSYTGYAGPAFGLSFSASNYAAENNIVEFACMWSRPMSVVELESITSSPYQFIRPPLTPRSYFFGEAGAILSARAQGLSGATGCSRLAKLIAGRALGVSASKGAESTGKRMSAWAQGASVTKSQSKLGKSLSGHTQGFGSAIGTVVKEVIIRALAARAQGQSAVKAGAQIGKRISGRASGTASFKGASRIGKRITATAQGSSSSRSAISIPDHNMPVLLLTGTPLTTTAMMDELQTTATLHFAS